MPASGEVDVAEYRRILEECVPELAISTCELAGEGWDSVAMKIICDTGWKRCGRR